MNLLNIIDTIYESKYFPTILIISIIVLVVLFVSVTILGMKDAKRGKEPKKKKREELKDITFEEPKEQPEIKEDVTFEIPVLTKNLENFKKTLEEEIEKEEKINVIKKSSNKEENKPSKILDKKTIDSTDVIPIIKPKAEKEVKKEEKKVEEASQHHREIFKELFKDRKEKNVEPPKIKDDGLEEQKKVEPPKKEIEKNNNQQKIDVDKVLSKTTKENQIKRNDIKPLISVEPEKPQEEKKEKKEKRYSGDDDF